MAKTKKSDKKKKGKPAGKAGNDLDRKIEAPAKPAGKAENELERKLEVLTKEAIIKIRDHFIEVARAQGQKIEYKYYPRHYQETEDCELHAKNISWRLQREKHKGYKQTIKYEIEVDAPLAPGETYRRETSDIIDGCRPDFNQITDPETRAKVAPFKDKKMIWVGTADFERDYFNLVVGKGKDKGTIEIAFDIGHYEIAGDETPHLRFKIEIEHKKGSKKALDVIQKLVFAFNETLGDQVRIDPYKSKSDEIVSLYLRQKQKAWHNGR